MYNPALPHLLGGVRSRTLVVWGRGDTVVPLECGEAYARAIPGSRLAVVEKAGHCVDMEQPDALVKLISEFTAGS
jgi:pimeloyl-ACP methyl ester carboxylesterase